MFTSELYKTCSQNLDLTERTRNKRNRNKILKIMVIIISNYIIFMFNI